MVRMPGLGIVLDLGSEWQFAKVSALAANTPNATIDSL